MDLLLAKAIPIAQLRPDDALSGGALRGVVTIIWPYSASKQSISLLLVERDFRLRRTRGQVRLTFRGHSATAVAGARVSSGDELALSLDGAVFQEDAAKERTPGRGIEWQLEYSRRLHLAIEREGGKPMLLEINRSTPTPELNATPIIDSPEDASESLRLTAPGMDEAEQVWESPAFLSNRPAYDHPFLSHFSFDDENEPFEEAKRSKRTKFGRRSGQWRFADPVVSPTKDRSTGEDAWVASLPSSGAVSESGALGIQPEETANVDLAGGSILTDPFVEGVRPDEGMDGFQIPQEMLEAPLNELPPIPSSQAPPGQMNVSVPFAAAHDDEALTDLPSMGLPTVGTYIDFQDDPLASIPTSGLLTTPDFPSFPEETTPVFDKKNSTPALPRSASVDATHAEESYVLSHVTGQESLGTPDLDHKSVPPPSTDREQALSREHEVKSGTANQPIEIIDLGSDSSSSEEAPQLDSILPQDEILSEDDSVSEDDQQREALSPSNEGSDDENSSVRQLSGSEIYDDEESEQLYETEQRPRMLERQRSESVSSDASSREEYSGEADAEGEDYDEDEVYETHRKSDSGSSIVSETIAATQLSREKQRRLSEHLSSDAQEEDSLSDGTESGHTVPDVAAAQSMEFSTSRADLRDDNGAPSKADGARTAIPSVDEELATSPATETEQIAPDHEPLHDKVAPLPRLVTRQRSANQGTILNGDAPLESSEDHRGASSKAAGDGSMVTTEEQGRSTKHITSTTLTVAASTAAEAIKQKFEMDRSALVGGFRTRLAYFVTIASLPQYYNSHVDVIAVVVGQTGIQRAKAGPRDYFTTLAVSDPWSEETGSPSYVAAQILRRNKAALPETNVGDAIILRQFKVQQREGRLQLLSRESSAWAVFAEAQPGKVAIRGPPVELGAEEEQLADGLQRWWAALEHKVMAVEEPAAPIKPHKNQRMKEELLDSTPPASPERHVLRDGSSYADGPGEAVHKLRDGATYSD